MKTTKMTMSNLTMMLINENHSTLKYDERSNADKETDDLLVDENQERNCFLVWVDVGRERL